MDVWPARVQSNRQIILGRRIAFQVTARFKGDPGLETLTVMSLCAHSFERDATYLVFAAPDFNGAPTAPEFLPTTNLDRDGLCPEDRQALGAPLAGALDTRSPPAPRDSALHRTARRVAVILLVAEIELREGWRRWNWTEHGDETQFASQLAGAAALGWWMVLLRRRRFALCAWLGLAVPSAVALTFVAWASWRNYPWIADLLR